MQRSDFERAVARVTGESHQIVRQRGLQPFNLDHDNELLLDDRPPLYVDWDALDAERLAVRPAA